MHLEQTIAKIKNWDDLKNHISQLKQKGEKIIFTNGCFDILHRGHVEYLSKAASLGNKLIVGLNSDLSVKKLKGESRPIQDQESRALILAALQCVDFVVLFEEETPYKLIETIRPSILVKGGDYNADDVVGKDLVEKVEIIDFVEGHSTTNIIKKL